MVVCVTKTADDRAGGGFGRAHAVVVADLRDGAIQRREDHAVRWDELHDARAEGLHHAAIARFLREQGVQVVMTGGMGPGMVRMLDAMGIEARLGVAGPLEEVLLEAARPTA